MIKIESRIKNIRIGVSMIRDQAVSENGREFF